MTLEFVDVTDKKNIAAPANTPQTLLSWLAIEWPPNFTRSRGLGRLAGALLTLAIPALFLLALLAAFAVLGKTIWDVFTDGGSGPSLGVGAMITALLGVPFVIWGTVIRQKSLEFQKEGHITDRISAAVEQLGAEKVVKRTVDVHEGKIGATLNPKEYATKEETVRNIEVRIGGLLSLERIAQDSTRYDRGRDHVRVMEIICAYVRENAPASEAVDCPLSDWEPLAEDASEEERDLRNTERKERFPYPHMLMTEARKWALGLTPIREDIQMALNILKRRSPDQRRVEANWPRIGQGGKERVFDELCFPRLPVRKDAPFGKEVQENFRGRLSAWRQEINKYAGYRIDLQNTNLQRADLSSAEFSGTLLQGARLEGADLARARLEAANLQKTRLTGASLHLAHLECAKCTKIVLEGANLVQVHAEGADFWDARFEGANLYGASLAATNLRRARFDRAYTQDAQLDFSDMTEAKLGGTNFAFTYLEAAIVQQATIDTSTSFVDASVYAVQWKDMSLKKAMISQKEINVSFGDGSVRLPDGIKSSEARWPEEDLRLVDYDAAYKAWLETLSD